MNEREQLIAQIEERARKLRDELNPQVDIEDILIPLYNTDIKVLREIAESPFEEIVAQRVANNHKPGGFGKYYD